MNIGYASKTLSVPETNMRAVTKKHASEDALTSTIEHNLIALDAALDYCARNGIHLFRISSDVIPFGSSPVNRLDWTHLFAVQLAALGEKARSCNIRLSMHPGQYTVLNSPDDSVVARAVDDLAYHTAFLDSLGMEADAKIILHIGGMYGNREAALERFVQRFETLDNAVKRRLVVENDDRLFTAEDALSISRICGIPFVFDVLHHEINHVDNPKSSLELIDIARSTWKREDGAQKIHYSQQALGKKKGSHSDTISLPQFLNFASPLLQRSDLDVMLEVKDKNISAVKCLTALNPRGKMADLEREWARYKYAILEHDQAAYQEIRRLLKDKSAYPAIDFYGLVEDALAKPPSMGSAGNAIQHVWGYVSNQVNAREKAAFERLELQYEVGAATLSAVKRRLFLLSERYGQEYLTHSYYFDL